MVSWRLRVVHRTGYHYTLPATQSYNEARLTPRSDHTQTVVANRLDTTPATREYRYTDYWGTVVSAFDLHTPHTEFRVVATSVVTTSDPLPPVRTHAWADLRRPDVTDAYAEYLQPTAYTPQDAELERMAHTLSARTAPADAVFAISQWVRDELTYRPGSTGVHSSASDAWSAREGVCQDYAHVVLVMLRAIGVPARYVSGYLYGEPGARPGRTVHGESHAWVEVWTGGWWAYDPTNALPIGARHVSVARGRDYADVTPLKGVFTGGGTSTLDVAVHLTRLA